MWGEDRRVSAEDNRELTQPFSYQELGTRFEVQNGKATRFWSNIWCEGRRLQESFPDLFAIAKNQNEWVSDVWQQNRWAPRFRRPLGEVELWKLFTRPQDREGVEELVTRIQAKCTDLRRASWREHPLGAALYYPDRSPYVGRTSALRRPFAYGNDMRRANPSSGGDGGGGDSMYLRRVAEPEEALCVLDRRSKEGRKKPPPGEMFKLVLIRLQTIVFD
ncbi:unnamed protein product [Triticum turgidum subsp. durum]|uniref:Uncharacterized protein n=1 Tax=Triticum turgidum subsp. durum TaxID=4567 RepID=A0A9R1Q4K7_TRITD|nr:unnamed protein product [Triticum turgidum subsp. durum]